MKIILGKFCVFQLAVSFAFNRLASPAVFSYIPQIWTILTLSDNRTSKSKFNCYKMAWTSVRPNPSPTILRLCSCSANRFISSKNDNLSFTKSEKYQLLQKSPVKTDFFQRSLPRLPIPKLNKTCER